MANKKDARRAAMKAKMGTTGKVVASKTKSAGYLNLPDGIEKFKIDKKGTKVFDIISYYNEVECLVSNPVVTVDKKDKEANFTYYRPYLRHSINQQTVACPRTIGEECPICDYVDKVRKNWDKLDEDERKELGKIRAKQRTLYNVLFDGELFVWDVSAAHFEDKLRNEYQEDENNRDFAFLDDGLSLKVRYKQSEFSKDYFEADRIDFIKRDDIDPAVLDERADLNKVLEFRSFDDLVKLLNDADQEEEEEEDYEEEKEEKPSEKTQEDVEEESAPEETSEEDGWGDEEEADW